MAQWTIIVVVIVIGTLAITIILTLVLAYLSEIKRCEQLYSEFAKQQETYEEDVDEFSQKLQNLSEDGLSRQERHLLDDEQLKLITEKGQLIDENKKLDNVCPDK